MARHRRGRHGPSHRTAMLGGLALGVVLGGGLIAAAAIPLAKGPPALELTLSDAPHDAPMPTLPFPSEGEAAVEIPTLHVTEWTKDQSPVPIASVTKLMTAYVTLSELPLSPNEQGPTIVVSADDVALYHQELRAGDSCVQVVAGEVLTERQLLDGLLVRSADNYASLVADLVAGDEPAFVELMNADASRLGLTATHYADASGLDADSASSALDVLHLAVLLMRNPTFAEIVRQPSVVLPVAGQVANYQPYLGQPGVVGIKTGSTLEALGCDVMAFDASDAGRVVQIVDVVLGQPASSLRKLYLVRAAARAALVLASATAHHLGFWRVTTAHAPAGTLGWPAAGVDVVASATIEVPTFGDVPARADVEELAWGADAVAGHQHVATVVVTTGAYRLVSNLTTASALTRPSLWQRLR